MEKDICSPIILKSTPIKRLGLSRKRKSCGSDGNLSQIGKTDNVLVSPVQSPNVKIQKTNKIEAEIKESETVVNNVDTDEIMYYQNEIETIKKRIQEKSKELEELKTKNSNIVNLEKLVDLWENGCRSAFLYFIELLKERHSKNIDNNAILNQLGIIKTMTKYFENDSEIFPTDN